MDLPDISGIDCGWRQLWLDCMKRWRPWDFLGGSWQHFAGRRGEYARGQHSGCSAGPGSSIAPPVGRRAASINRRAAPRWVGAPAFAHTLHQGPFDFLGGTWQRQAPGGARQRQAALGISWGVMPPPPRRRPWNFLRGSWQYRGGAPVGARLHNTATA